MCVFQWKEGLDKTSLEDKLALKFDFTSEQSQAERIGHVRKHY